MFVFAPMAALFATLTSPPTMTVDWLSWTFGSRQRLPAMYMREAPLMLFFSSWSHVLPVWPA